MPKDGKDKVKRPNGPPARSRARRASMLQLEQYFTDQSRGPVDHAFMIAALQTHPGNRVHLMLVSPFIVETGGLVFVSYLYFFICICFLCWSAPLLWRQVTNYQPPPSGVFILSLHFWKGKNHFYSQEWLSGQGFGFPIF